VRNAIQLFMWGYQPHFRIEVELRACQVLQTIAPTVQPRVLLIGIRSQDKEDGHAVCVEPEDEDWDPTIFFGCHQRAEEIHKNHPDHSMFYGDEPSMRDKPENIRKKSALQAVKEILSKYDEEKATRSYCGWPGKVEGYYVVPVLQFRASQIDAYPRFSLPISFDQWKSPASLLDAAIECLLADATTALGQKEPGRFLGRREADAPAVLRRAANAFCSAITLATKDVMFQDIFEPLNIISSLPYEGAGAIGEILFAPNDSVGIDFLVRFHTPVPLSRHRLARKIVEMTAQNVSSVCHGSGGISGLGSLRSKEADNILRVAFTGHYEWDLHYNDILLMKVSYGVPRLPLPRLKQEEFYSAAARIFTTFNVLDGRRLWEIIEAAMEQQHGTMLVFSEAAEEEAHRLRNHSISIDPTVMTPELVRRITGIDGAMLLSPKGVCHAISVILDGIATDAGDSSRGARYNSALRYLGSSPSPAICLVVSRDGGVDLLPRLRPQVRKTEIKSYVDALTSKDKDNFHKTLQWLEAHRFYLTASDCAVVNAEMKRIYSVPLEVGELRFEVQEFVPHSGMDDSYYLAEQ
jgi:DisA bacterial checkpoint controller nucleotide-binding